MTSDPNPTTPVELAAVEKSRDEVVRLKRELEAAIERLGSALFAARKVKGPNGRHLHGANELARLAYPGMSKPIALRYMNADTEQDTPDTTTEATVTDLPRVTDAGLALLARAADATVHVYRDPARPGNDVTKATLDRLRADKLVTLGDYAALKGKPIVVTDLGHAALSAAASKKG